MRHVQVHQDQVGVEAVQGFQNVQRVEHHVGLHAGVAQDAFGEQGLVAVVFDDKHAEGFAAAGADQLAQALEHLGGIGFDQQQVDAGAFGIQAQGDVVGFAQGHQLDGLAAQFAGGAHGGADLVELVAEAGVHQGQARGQGAQQFAQLLGGVEQFDFVAGGFHALVEFQRKRAVFGEVVDADAGDVRGGVGHGGHRGAGRGGRFGGGLGRRRDGRGTFGCRRGRGRRRCRGRGRLFFDGGGGGVGRVFAPAAPVVGGRGFGATALLHHARRRADVGAGFGAHGHGLADFLDQVPQPFAGFLVGQGLLLQGVVQHFVQVQEMLAGLVQAVLAAGVAQAQRVFVQKRQSVDVPAVLQEVVQAAADLLHAPRKVAQESGSVCGES